ncbi:putative oxidoreductase C terminal-domain-containing protein [Butyriboletus roseoflavus]|nr:putative oxidoreductase C terminal-domain-containing protein [Butyriboletus roseoflavus]
MSALSNPRRLSSTLEMTSTKQPPTRRGSERRLPDRRGSGYSSGFSSRRPSIDPSRLIPMDKFALSPFHFCCHHRLIHAQNYPRRRNTRFQCRLRGRWEHYVWLAPSLQPHLCTVFTLLRFGRGSMEPLLPLRTLGLRLKVVALIDPATERAAAVLQKKCDSFVVSAYRDTRVYKTLDDFVKNLSPKDRPRAFVIGSPPMFRGSLQPGRDIEMQIQKHFPGVAMFIEKPVATGAKSEIEESFKVANFISESGAIVSVGYMLRYLKATQKMKQIIEENNLVVMATIARYACAYESIAKPDWWDKSKSAGPIVEQGTHFCDLSRYFGGEVDISSVVAHALEWDENAGQLSKIAIDENKIAPENRIPRVTSATWKYDSGAVGSFTHVATLQGHNYSCELEVHADGYCLKLVNPYVQPILYVRKPGDDHEQVFNFPDDDPFFSEARSLSSCMLYFVPTLLISGF